MQLWSPAGWTGLDSQGGAHRWPVAAAGGGPAAQQGLSTGAPTCGLDFPLHDGWRECPKSQCLKRQEEATRAVRVSIHFQHFLLAKRITGSHWNQMGGDICLTHPIVEDHVGATARVVATFAT